MKSTVLRPCKAEDVPGLVGLCALHAEHERVEYEKWGKQEKLLNALFGNPPVLGCFVVEANGTLVGYASYTIDYSTWEADFFLHLDTLFLIPSFRGIGLGKQLLLSLRQIAKEKGCTHLQWQTPSFNEPAIKFYHHLGAKSKEKQRFYWAIEDK